MYDLLLQSAYPMAVKPSQMIRPEAVKVWQYYLDKNPHIETYSITEKDPNYTVTWKPDEFVEPKFDTKITSIINTTFRLQPYYYFNPFVKDSEDLMKQHHISKTTVFKKALEFFHNKYYVSVPSEEAINIPEKDIADKYLLINKINTTVQFLIQDKAKVYAYAELINKEGKYYQTKNIAAEPGWGPFLYDAVMLMLDKPIHPSTSLSSESFAVINNYLHNRPDVIKAEFPGRTFTSLDLNGKETFEEKYFKVLNYTYTINNSTRRMYFMNWYQKSLEFEKQMTAKLPNWKKVRFEQALRWFHLRYMEIV
jgi:hypothetical protein